MVECYRVLGRLVIKNGLCNADRDIN
jgi:hypothetical protein